MEGSRFSAQAAEGAVFQRPGAGAVAGEGRAGPGLSSYSLIALRRLFAAGASGWFLPRGEAGRGWMVASADKGLLSKKVLVLSNFGYVLRSHKGHS